MRGIPAGHLPNPVYWFGPFGRRRQIWMLMAYIWDFQHGDKIAPIGKNPTL